MLTTLAPRARAWLRPLGPISLGVPAVAIAATVLAKTWPMLRWPYPLWIQTSAQFHQQFPWAGLIAGTAACWSATVLNSARPAQPRPPDRPPGPATVARHLTVLVGALVGAYVLALLPLAVSTTLAKAIGTPDPLAALSGILAMIAAVSVGYTLGTVFPYAVMVPITLISFYALVMAGCGGETYAATPVLALEPGLGQRESIPLLVFRVALFTMITISAVAIAGTWITDRATDAHHAHRRIINVAIYSAAPIALITVSLIHPPVVFTVDPQPHPSCTVRRDIRYCVHPDNQPRLADLVRAIDPIISRFGTKPTNLDQVWDQALTLHPIDAAIANSLDIAWLNPDGTIHSQIADTIAGVNACASPDQHTKPDIEKIARVADDISDYLTTGELSGTLSGMSVADVQRWIRLHQDQLHNCSLALEQLPGIFNR